MTTLRRQFSPDSYLGIEVEVNQKHSEEGEEPWRELRGALCEVLADLVNR